MSHASSLVRHSGVAAPRARRMIVAVFATCALAWPMSANATGNLKYHGGPVLTHPTTTYFIYWRGTSGTLPSDYLASLTQFVSDWSGSVAHRVLTQYYQDAGGRDYVSSVIHTGETVVSSAPFPRPTLTDGEIAREVRTVVESQRLPEGYRVNYAVILPQQEPTDFECAWHDWVGDPTTQQKIFYSVIPYYLRSTACPMPGGPYPHGEDIDNAIDLLSHELSEMATDPWNTEDPTARHYLRTNTSWFIGTGRHEQEVGDLCRPGGHARYGPRDGAGADVVLNGHPYLIQEEWSNLLHQCTLGYAQIPQGYRDCHKAPGGTDDVFVSHMSCGQAIAVLSPPLGPGSPPPPSPASLGFNCAYIGRTYRYFYGYRWDLVRCTYAHRSGGFAYIHYPAAAY